MRLARGVRGFEIRQCLDPTDRNYEKLTQETTPSSVYRQSDPLIEYSCFLHLYLVSVDGRQNLKCISGCLTHLQQLGLSKRRVHIVFRLTVRSLIGYVIMSVTFLRKDKAAVAHSVYDQNASHNRLVFDVVITLTNRCDNHPGGTIAVRLV